MSFPWASAGDSRAGPAQAGALCARLLQGLAPLPRAPEAAPCPVCAAPEQLCLPKGAGMLQQSLELLHPAETPLWLLMDPRAQLCLSWHSECQPHFTWQPVPAQCQNSVHKPRAACACSPCPFQCPVH